MKARIIVMTLSLLLLSCKHPLSTIFNTIEPITFTNQSINQISISPIIVYIDENNNRKEINHLSKTANIGIPLRKNRLTPVLVFSSAIDSAPLGCIYPISTELDAHSGFAAWILYKLLVSSNEDPQLTHQYLSYFNWAKFIAYIKKYENPWVLDQDSIFENIADKTFNVYSIKEK